MSVAFAPRGAPVPRNGSAQSVSSAQSALPIELRPPVPAAAVSLLTQARHGLAEADRERDPAPRFIAAYLSALRAAAAVLVARGRPHRGRARPESAWTLLGATVPELEQWAAYFAANSARQAAAQAGITRRITGERATELFRHATEFVALAHRAVHGTRGPLGEPDGARRERVARCRAPARVPAHRCRSG